MLTYNLLLIISILPLINIFLIIFISNIKFCKLITLIITNLVFIFSFLIWILFNSKTSLFQFCLTLFWSHKFNLSYSIGIDGISIFFILLTSFLILVCIITSWSSIKFLLKEYLICFLILEFCLIQVFCVLDLLLFYIFFESILIPMFLIIGLWGSRERKIRAAYQFFLYTLIGSFLMLIALVFIYLEIGTFDIQILSHYFFNKEIQIWLWLALFIGFAVKIPMFPFHLWLPEAHAEAPTAGSIILAGILLKIGGYGFLRFSLPMFPEASVYFSPLIFTLSIIAVIYGSLTTLRQIDLKKIIAYSSISHMGFVTIGIFSFNIQGIEGSILLMLSHGIISSALFFCIGILYDRYKTRLIKYYSGLVQFMPLFIIFFSFFSFSNTGFPGTSSFVAELLILFGSSNFSLLVTFFLSFGIIFSASYSIWLLNRISFNNINFFYIKKYQDISRREFLLLFLLLLFTLLFGIFPYLLLDEIHFSVLNLLLQINN
uniref:NADH dehydrogenase subunit 4 n=1 Tax=Griffithsia okiensis TaxID=291168 RepID=UPI002E79BB12|nr:NADH dehydrogenase subunit 4 [Griffithsia okiensis]WQF69544.1 NADH dehydrogenase subunit 4 [Griffithsia okiensis]